VWLISFKRKIIVSAVEQRTKSIDPSHGDFVIRIKTDTPITEGTAQTGNGEQRTVELMPAGTLKNPVYTPQPPQQTTLPTWAFESQAGHGDPENAGALTAEQEQTDNEITAHSDHVCNRTSAFIGLACCCVLAPPTAYGLAVVVRETQIKGPCYSPGDLFRSTPVTNVYKDPADGSNLCFTNNNPILDYSTLTPYNIVPCVFTDGAFYPPMPCTNLP
jgi:hypothetical protein